MNLEDKIKQIKERFDKNWNFNGDFQNKPVFSDIKNFLEQSIREAVTEALENVRLEKRDHSSKGINQSHEKDEYWGCCECYEDGEYNQAKEDLDSKINTHLK